VWTLALEPRRLTQRLAYGTPHAPDPQISNEDQRSTGLAADLPTPALAGSMFYRGVCYRFGFPLHIGLAGQANYGERKFPYARL
jgi:hypothetical protein